MLTNILDNKPKITKEDGTVIIDFTMSSFNNNGDAVAFTAYKLTDEYCMRPDKISLSAYNTNEYDDYILKFNGISNPFSINDGDIILAPKIEQFKEHINTTQTNTFNEDLIRNTHKYIDLKKIPKTSESLRNYINSTDSNINAPNIANVDETQITYRNGRVYFGEGVSSSVMSNRIVSDSNIKIRNSD